MLSLLSRRLRMLSLSLQLLGDGIRDLLDPRLRKSM